MPILLKSKAAQPSTVKQHEERKHRARLKLSSPCPTSALPSRLRFRSSDLFQLLTARVRCVSASTSPPHCSSGLRQGKRESHLSHRPCQSGTARYR